MTILAEILEKINTVFDEKHLNHLAKHNRFMQRVRKITPKQFLEQFICLRVEQPDNSLNDIAFALYQQADIRITKQALSKKFTANTVHFFQHVLNELLAFTRQTQQQQWKHLPLINKIYAVDSSEIRLHQKLSPTFPQVRRQGAAVKLQALMDITHQQLTVFDIEPSKNPDQRYKAHLQHMGKNDLSLGDLGYFSTESFRTIEQKGGFFLYRYFRATHLYEANTAQKISLTTLLKNTRKKTIRRAIKLGAKQFSCYLVGLKLPKAAYQQRLKALAEQRRKGGRPRKAPLDELDKWTLFITNLPPLFEPKQLLALYRLRWQIELLFKTMKTCLHLRRLNERNPHRMMVSLYAALIAMTLLSLITLSLGHEEISLYKACKLFCRSIREIIMNLQNKQKISIWLNDIFIKFSTKESRAKRPSTKNIVEACFA